MAATSTYGWFSESEVYTLDEIAHRVNRSKDWVYNTFVRPVDHHSKKRRLDKDGHVVPGVYHVRMGGQYLIPGRSIIAWILEWGDRCEGDSFDED